MPIYAAGIPQLIVPAHDQPDKAVRIRRVGIGDFLLPKAYTSANIEQNLGHLMSRRQEEMPTAC